MLDQFARRARAARLRLGLFLVELGARVAGMPASRPNSSLVEVSMPPGGVVVGPEAREMLERGRRPARRREPAPVRIPLVGSADDLRQRAARLRGEG